jgi:hypothetical protein
LIITAAARYMLFLTGYLRTQLMNGQSRTHSTGSTVGNTLWLASDILGFYISYPAIKPFALLKNVFYAIGIIISIAVLSPHY